MYLIRLVKLSLVLVTLSALADNKVSCSYQDSESRELEPTEYCGNISEDGLLVLSKKIVERVNWNKYGLDCALVYGTKDQDGWYFINQKGEGRISPFLQDNDCAPFTEGLAVGLSYGKVVFYDQALKIVKRTEYIWASGFYKGYAKVCKGDLHKQYDSHGEHYQYRGGICGFIDTRFEIVVPVRYP